MEKKTARSIGLSARAGIPADRRMQYNEDLLRQMKQLAENRRLIGCYVSMKDEADTLAFLSWCFEQHKPVAVPLVEGNTLTFHRITSMQDLHPGTFGVLEPLKEEAVDCSEIDLMFVPLSSFDRRNQRTGYGRGYYDSVLETGMYKAGIAYPEQRVDSIDTDPWDVPLDEILVANAE
jgi:5-formyltetrahydrofolate cyclo-ligase